MKRIREVLIAEALNERPPSDFSDEDIEDENDKEFYERSEKIIFENGILKIVDIFSESD